MEQSPPIPALLCTVTTGDMIRQENVTPEVAANLLIRDRRVLPGEPVLVVAGGLARMWRPPSRHEHRCLYTEKRLTQPARDKEYLAAFCAVAVAIGVVYWDVLRSLGLAWYTDDNYSHGFFIAPLAAYFAWERRAEFTAKPIKPSAFGLIVVAGSLVLLVGGILGAELFISRFSFLGVLTGTILFLYGWQRLWVLAFPLAFMLLMIPIPAIIFNQIAFPLQLLASNVGESTIRSLDIPILREGNVLILANARLEVAEACSGIRSLVSLFTLGLVFGYFVDKRAWVRVVIALSSIPVAILANGLRVASAGVAAHNFGNAGVEGLFHEFSGWVVFVVAFLMMLGFQRLLQRFLPASLPPRVSNPDTIPI